jgi:Rha family phage regulatory protein
MNLPAEIKVELRDGVAMVSSLQIAATFNKRHDTVLRSIQNLEMSDEFRGRNFVASSYRPENGTRDYPMYLMTRNGAICLTVTFTGKEAARVRENVITALERAEEMVKRGVEALDIPLLLEMAAREYRQAIHERDMLADEVTAVRQQQKLIAYERTKDIDRVREAERKASVALQKMEAVAKHAYKSHREVEDLLKGIGDLFSAGEAENITRLPLKKRDDDKGA